MKRREFLAVSFGMATTSGLFKQQSTPTEEAIEVLKRESDEFEILYSQMSETDKADCINAFRKFAEKHQQNRPQISNWVNNFADSLIKNYGGESI